MSINANGFFKPPEFGVRELVKCSSEMISIFEKFSLPSPSNLIPLQYQEHTYRNNKIAKSLKKTGFQPSILRLDRNATNFLSKTVAFNIGNNSSSCCSQSSPTTTALITNVGTAQFCGRADNVILLDSGSKSISTTLAVIDSAQNRTSYQMDATVAVQSHSTSAENEILPTRSFASERNLLPEMMMMMMTAANVNVNINVGPAGSVARAVDNHYSYV